MCRWISALLLFTSTVVAQDAGNVEELRRMHQEAVTQLKAAQDRKNELAVENEKLTARIAELETELAQKNIQIAGFAERTWFLRMHYATWNRFIERYPELKARWQAFLAAGVLDLPSDLPDFAGGQTG